MIATSDIKKGEEITFNYDLIKTCMKKKKVRQECLKFTCRCDFCLDVKEDEDKIAAYETFEVRS